MVFQISEEQSNIVNTYSNLKVNCVAGSGKTTTIFKIAEKYLNKKILLLTYSSLLKTESRKKITTDNIEVHSFHSFIHTYYTYCSDDFLLNKILNSKHTNDPANRYDIIIVDEAQDLTPLLVKTINFIYKRHKKPDTIFMLFGDAKQCIYAFKNASPKYLLNPEKYFPHASGEYKNMTLSTSYRLPDTIGNFINNNLHNEEILKTNKESNLLPIYINLDTNNNSEINKLLEYIEERIKLYKQDEMMFLAHSIKRPKYGSGRILRLIESILIRKKNYIHHKDDCSSTDINVLKNKSLISTTFQSKGLERDLVVVFDFDKFYTNDNKCSNILYVAATRAKKELICISCNAEIDVNFNNSKKYLYKNFNNDKFVKSCEKNKYSFIHIHNDKKSFKVLNLDKPYKLKSITEISTSLDVGVINEISELINVETIKNNKITGKVFNYKPIQRQIKTEDGSYLYEDVARFIGNLIPVYYLEYWLSPNDESLLEHDSENFVMDKKKLTTIIKIVINKKRDWIYPKYQIVKNILTIKELDKICSNLDILLKKCYKKSQNKITYEKDLGHIFEVKMNENGCDIIKEASNIVGYYTKDRFIINKTDFDNKCFHMIGTYDMLCNDDLWEFKLSRSGCYRAYIQSLLYSYMLNLNKSYVYYLDEDELDIITFKDEECKKRFIELIVYNGFK